MRYYTTCPATITSPAPPEGALAIGLKANMICGADCLVDAPEGAVVDVRCPYGHQFFHEAKRRSVKP